MPHSQWGYSNENGPHVWAAYYKEAAGEHQSPINIQVCKACYDPMLKETPLVTNYHEKMSNASICNTGESVKINCRDETSTLTGGPLLPGHVYRPLQFHFHWGSDDERGSEHLVDGKPKAAELHMVHWNSTMFKTPDEAANDHQQLGLCVLAVFIKVGKHNAALDSCFKQLPYVNEAGMQHEVGHVNLRALLPHNIADYWTYGGSLTTPPCTECVTWILFHEAIELSHNQLNSLRKLHSSECGHQKESAVDEHNHVMEREHQPHHHHHILPHLHHHKHHHEDNNDDDVDSHIQDNFRPAIPLGKRILRSSFEIEQHHLCTIS